MRNDRYLVLQKFNDAIQIHVRQYQRNGKGVIVSYKTRHSPISDSIRHSPALSRFYQDSRRENSSRRQKCFIQTPHRWWNLRDSQLRLSSRSLKRYFLPDGQMNPHTTKKGITLRLGEWDSLVTSLENIKDLVDTTPCFYKDDHHSLVTHLTCLECNPFQLDPLPN